MLTVIHSADLHLDSPFSGLDPQGAAQRRGEQRLLLDDLAQLARDRAADLVLLSGDLLDGDRAFRETVSALARCLGEMGCPVFLAPGNHDPLSPRSPYLGVQWPENVHLFSSQEIETVDLPALGCAVHGAAFLSPRLERSPLQGFCAPRDGRIHLMALHGEVDRGGHYGPITPMDIAASGLHYLALGHVHQFSGLQRAGETFWAYPGCPEGRGFDELGAKGALCLTVATDGVSCDFVPLARRRYEILSVDLTGRSDPLAAVSEALPPRAQADLYRVLLTGQFAGPLDCKALSQSLMGRCYALELRNQTRLPTDLRRRREGDDLTGLFLQEMAARQTAADQGQTLELALRFGLAALEQGEDIAP